MSGKVTLNAIWGGEKMPADDLKSLRKKLASIDEDVISDPEDLENTLQVTVFHFSTVSGDSHTLQA